MRWDDPEGWYGEGGGRRVQGGAHMYTCGGKKKKKEKKKNMRIKQNNVWTDVSFQQHKLIRYIFIIPDTEHLVLLDKINILKRPFNKGSQEITINNYMPMKWTTGCFDSQRNY